MAAAAASLTWVLFFLLAPEFGRCVLSQIGLGSRLLAKDQNQAWVSDNGTFAFGFTPGDSPDQYLLAIWFAELPGDIYPSLRRRLAPFPTANTLGKRD